MAFLKNQFKQVFRRLSRAPTFTIVTLITLGVGIGATTAVFTVLDGVLLKPLPYAHTESLVSVKLAAPGLNVPELVLGPSNYFIYREQSRAFEDIGLFTSDSVSLTGVGEPEEIRALRVTDGVLPILGVHAAQGREFSHQDDSPSGADTAVLTYGFWRRKFGGDRSIVGRSITVDGKPFQVIGILPESFRFLGGDDPSLLLPFKFDRTKVFLGNFSYQGVARLKPGVTLTQANADVERMLPIVIQSFPAPPGFSIKIFEKARLLANVRPLKDDVVGDVGKALWVLMAGIGMVLLIACANVANLFLIRVEGRQQELAIRAALGAGRGRIAVDLIFESLIVGLMGSALGLGLAYAAVRALVAFGPANLPRLHEISINAPVLIFTLIISLLSSLLFSSLPVLKYAGAQLGTGLREGGRGASQTRERHRARNVLVVVQVALALVLLVGSGLMIRTFSAMTHVDPGFTALQDVQTFRLSVPEADVKEPERVIQMQEDILKNLKAIPGVTSVGLSSTIPMDGNGSFDPVFAEDKTYAEGQLPPIRRFKFVSPDFYKTLGTPFIAGRDLTWTDVIEKRPVVIVSESMARDYWRDPASAIGKRIRQGSKDDWREIVGVYADIHEDGVSREEPSSVSWPVMMSNFYGEKTLVRRGLAFALRSPRAGSESLMKEVRQAVWSVDANLPLADVHTLGEFYRDSMARTSFLLVMLAIAGGMALLLGVVGLYGVIAYSVSQRRREIGIRVALGAQQEVVTRMFVRHGLLLTGIGVVCGLGAAAALMRLVKSLLFHVSPLDPPTYAAVTLGLVAAAMLASYVPSRRAARVNPVDALRAE